MNEGGQPGSVGEQHQQPTNSKVVQQPQLVQSSLQSKPPPHHGSSSTTFSTGSSLSTSTSCGDGEAIEPSSYYSSAAESSGVATMSSSDNLPPALAAALFGGGVGSRTVAPPADAGLDSDEDGGRNNTLKASSTSALNREALQWELGAAESSHIQAIDALRLQSSPGASATSIAAAAAIVSLAGPSSAPAGAAAFPRMSSTRSTGSGMTEAAICEAARKQAAALLPPTSPASHSTNSSSQQLPPHSSTSPLPPPFTSVAMTCANSCTQIICTPLRTIVSQNRRRYQQDGFNLDLTYITDRIIAMGYPADTKEALYRNSMSHIVKFLEHYHPGHYKVFNLRGQYVYDVSKFHNRVVSFEMTDHHPPRLELMAPFCREVGDYLEADPRNVVAVHCKAGKGRTGVMICAYLCYISFYRTPRQNMDYYSIVRTHNNKGVTIPSQRRYVYYFSHLRERRLNYMPLRVELVGVYVERPPKLSGTFSKGALNVRVANGDVDVFLGDNLWLSAEKSEEEDEMHRRYPVMVGDDQYDPNRPVEEGGDCISRRCYGWSVPANKRVFLEGDIRVDIHQKRVLPVFNVKQEKKKIGRVWFNSMFVCPGFCGGQYVHGDEAYPYPEGESMIVQRVVRKKSKSSQSLGAPEGGEASTCFFESSSQHPHSTVDEEGKLPQQQHGGVERKMLAEEERQSSNSSLISKSKSSRMSRNVLRTTFNGISKKRPSRSPCSQLIDSEKKGWSSQDNDLGRSEGVDSGSSGAQAPPVRGHKCRSSLDQSSTLSSSTNSTRVCRSARGSGEGGVEMAGEEGVEDDAEEEIVVPEPPGLGVHCPPESLQEIYHTEKQAPRFGIVHILKEAYKRNLLRDLYNARRSSVPKEGNLMPKSPVGRPNAESSPRCLVRDKAEHVAIYSAQEIDGAHKSKEVDMNYFKLYVVTRCVDERNVADGRLADSFLRITHQKQLRRDEAKREKLEGRQKKLTSQPPPATPSATSGGDGVSLGDQGDDSSCSFSSEGIHDSAAGTQGRDSSPFEFNNDPRLNDPYLRKFFFRQRISSHSRHPNVHYHCPLLERDPSICVQHNCHLSDDVSTPSSSAPATKHQRGDTSDRRQPDFHPSRGLAPVRSGERDDGEERDDESSGGEEESGNTGHGDSFENFDFFHPNAFASLKERRVLMAREDSSTASLGSSTLHNRTPVDSTATPSTSGANTTTAIYVRSATLTSADARDQLVAGERSPPARGTVGRGDRDAGREERLRGRSTGDLLLGDGAAVRLGDEPARDFHPSDCSWASSSSTSSSTQSLEDPDSTTPPRTGS